MIEEGLTPEENGMLNRSLFIGSIFQSTGSLLLSYRATNMKIEEVSQKSPWYNEEDDRQTNKHRMKLLGAAVMGYGKFHKELTIIGIAKTIEDLIVNVNEYSELEFDFWKSDLTLVYFDEMKYIRQLNNCIKHSKGIVINDNSSCNKYLIDVKGLSEGTVIGEFLQIDIEEYIFKSFYFQMELAYHALGMENEWKITDDLKSIESLLIPDIIKF